MFEDDEERRAWPFTRTMLVWGAKPKWTLPTSPTSTGAPFTTLIGSLLNSSVVSGLEFSRMSYSVFPSSPCPPEDQVRVEEGGHDVVRRDVVAGELLGIDVHLDWALLPPYGPGIERPGS